MIPTRLGPRGLPPSAAVSRLLETSEWLETAGPSKPAADVAPKLYELYTPTPRRESLCPPLAPGITNVGVSNLQTPGSVTRMQQWAQQNVGLAPMRLSDVDLRGEKCSVACEGRAD